MARQKKTKKFIVSSTLLYFSLDNMWYITYNINMFNVLYYQKNDETRPAEEYILSEDIKIRAKILKNLGLL